MKKALNFIMLVIIVFTTIYMEVETTPVINLPTDPKIRREVIHNGSRDTKVVYLTIDDGYPAYNLRGMIDVIEKKGVTATFFLNGEVLDYEEKLVKRIIEIGSRVGCHTYSHTPITSLTEYELKQEIKKYENKYYQITGIQLERYFRPPQGVYSEKKLNILWNMGYKVFLWDVSFYDYNPKHDLGSDFGTNAILDQICNGSIILLHTTINSNVETLEKVIDSLLEQGYFFGDLKYV